MIGAYYPDGTGTIPTPKQMWESDTWHTARFHLKSTTSNAIFQVWIDGEELHNESGFGVGDTDSSADLIEGFSFTHNKDDSPNNHGDQYLYWGHIKIGTNDPGW
jgi:hypothetical protein